MGNHAKVPVLKVKGVKLVMINSCMRPKSLEHFDGRENLLDCVSLS